MKTVVAIIPRQRWAITTPMVIEALRSVGKDSTVEVVMGQPGTSTPGKYLNNNELRNFIVAEHPADYYVFLDNDCLPADGLVEQLLDTAEATGAWVVGPMYGEISQTADTIHMAGGWAHVVVNDDGSRTLTEGQYYPHAKGLEELRQSLRPRQPTGYVEFHCMLIRGDCLRNNQIVLDERLVSGPDHKDVCMQARDHGGQVLLEPLALATYLWPAGPYALQPEDLEYYNWIWTKERFQIAIDHFYAKWNAQPREQDVFWAWDCVNSHMKLVNGGTVRVEHNQLLVEELSNVRQVSRNRSTKLQQWFTLWNVLRKSGPATPLWRLRSPSRDCG